ncbi:hypothetical protein OGH69_05555 [Flavobacterium sp. MFBS3-15]|uniref:hypothetical protein n=1 Tax=Flavobacterium sp. MFBS3-15 TaxID=2989816 RepID=UPI0022360140|nr:hypothetical protein [Flavobacterium sp. MFBS3-15]MCW4468422.1 hypothetical protein [Flavobacterium sp. MFBS3-15]
MKSTALYVFLLLLLANAAMAQDYLEQMKRYDLSKVINPDSISDDSREMVEHVDPHGFIGDNFQRFQIHFTSFKKSKANPLVYEVKGKTRVKGNVCSFTGAIEITAAGYDGSLQEFMDPDYKGISLISAVTLYEDKSGAGSGVIKGTLVTDAVFNGKDKPEYNALMLMSDGYRNNQFTGEWTSYKTGLSKKCNWGDYRIPESGDLDWGAGEFMVNGKFKGNGWESYYDAYCCNPDWPETIAARKKEAEEWWK